MGPPIANRVQAGAVFLSEERMSLPFILDGFPITIYLEKHSILGAPI